MQKSIYRKYAVSTLCLLVVATLAACSGASSTDEDLAFEQNLIGNVQIDVNPSAQSVTVTPVGSPWLNNPVTGGDGLGNIPNVTITTANIAYANPVMDFRTSVKWTDATKDLWNVRLEVASSTDGDVRNLNDDRCTGVTPWTTCLAGANLPTITYASEVTSEGGETRALTSGVGSSSTLYLNSLHAGCGSISARWRLNEASGLNYRFWAKLYGTPAPINPILDARYDQTTSTVFTRVRKLTYATTNNPGEGVDATGMAANEWFYVHVYLDNPGNNNNFAMVHYDTFGNGNYVGPQHLEDQVNVAAYGGGASSTALYWFMDSWLPYGVRFDTAVVETASNEVNGIPPSTATTKFNTAKGTRLFIPFDSTAANMDGWNSAGDIFTSSNRMGLVKGVGSDFAATAIPAFYPNPCNNRALGTACPGGVRDGYTNLDVDIARIPLHIKSTAVSGQGSIITPATDTMFLLAAASSEGVPYNPGGWAFAAIQRSNSWPNWCEQTPGGICVTTGGAYNNERSYVCVQ